MANRWIVYGMLGCLAAICLWALSTIVGSSGEGSGDAEASTGVPVRYVSIADVFGELERPPVPFDHDQHTKALKAEGCTACHPEEKDGEEGAIRFDYPLERDESDRDALMESYHDACIGCHTERAARAKDKERDKDEEEEENGPVTCGECHAEQKGCPDRQYVPATPEYYEVRRDTYHRDCTACHREPAKSAEEAGPLDWKSFYVAQQQKAEAQWPKVLFDYYLHHKHDEALAGECTPCHTMPAEKMQEFIAERKLPAGQDWVQEAEQTSWLAERATAHAKCINCHLQRDEKSLDTGPVQCGECHAASQRTAAEMVDVPRPECDREEMILIELEEGARAKSVAFDHQSHVANSRSCQDCHHHALRPCQDCHTPEGSEEGDWVTLADAHHDISSTHSCVGCHEAEKKKADCAGCHQSMPGGLVQAGCSGCHTGTLDRLTTPGKLPAPEDLIASDVHEKFEIGFMEEAYEPSRMPHLEMAKKLTEISNGSKLASYFHTDQMTVCVGCHHVGPLAPGENIPTCRTCHTARDVPKIGTTSLLGSYHQRCLGCHETMDPAKEHLPQDCVGCHDEKPHG